MNKGAPVPPSRSSAPLNVEDQVLANIRGQKIGATTVGDLGLPEPFLRRVAGRVLQLSYQENFRIVVAEAPGQLEHEIWSTCAPLADVEIVRYEGEAFEIPDGSAAMPPARGFLPAVVPGDIAMPRLASGDPALVALIAQRLAKDGLLLTVAKAITLLQSAGPVDSGAIVEALKLAGFPVDLLVHFVPDGITLSAAEELVGWLKSKVVSTSPATWARALSKAEFQYRATEGFRASPDSGQASPTIARLQLSRGGYWIGPGDGGSIDLLRQVAEKLPNVQIVASVESRHVEEVRACLSDWHGDVRSRIRLVSQQPTLSQWAQDSSKNGVGTDGKPVTLIPRFATRGEEVSLYVPGDTCLGAALNAAGLCVRHSPLLFQGGNLLVVQEASGRRVLLAGEAEVLRNQSLGLTRDQAMAALNIEMGTDKCVALPAASIHIDYEVSCRTHEGKTIAFVVDVLAGARLVVEAALEVLVRLRRLTVEQASTVRDHLNAGRGFDAAALVWLAIRHVAVGPGRFPLKFAMEFRASTSDSGVGNLHRLMAALDILMCSSTRGTDELADQNMRVHLRVLARRLEDRAQLKAALRNLGWTVVPVPGLAHSERSINPVNGLHTPDAYLMPTYGGLFQGLDDAAQGVIERTLGPGVAVIPVRSGESQRRDGALRCSVCLL